MAEPFTVYIGNTSQPLYGQLKDIAGKPLNIGTSTVKFNMRYAESADLKVSGGAAVIDDATKGLVHYNWTSGNVDTAGEYVGWWQLKDTSNKVKDFPEFQIVIDEHAPGIRVKVGAIYRASRGIIPITWDALEHSDKYGDSLLQERIEAVKLSLFGTSVPVEDEATYDIRVLEFAAKLVAIQVIPAGVDYWGAQYQSFVAQGTQETASYPDRIAALWKVYERLLIQIAQDRPVVDEILDNPTVSRAVTDVPGVSGGIEEGFLTPVPSDNFVPFHFRKRIRPEDNLF